MTDHRRAIAKQLIHDAIALLDVADVKDRLTPSDKKVLQESLKKLSVVWRSLGSISPPGEGHIAAMLSTVATSLMNCDDPDLKHGVYSEVMKAAEIFEEMSQDL